MFKIREQHDSSTVRFSYTLDEETSEAMSVTVRRKIEDRLRKVSINWAAFGAVDIDTAVSFSLALQDAVAKAAQLRNGAAYLPELREYALVRRNPRTSEQAHIEIFLAECDEEALAQGAEILRKRAGLESLSFDYCVVDENNERVFAGDE